MTHTGRSLSEPALDTLDALHQHRLLTTSQLQEIVLPGRSLRRTQLLLGELVQRRLIDWVAASGKWPGPAERVWFVTRRGGAVVDVAPNKAEPRLRLVTADQAGGRLQPHTLAVNEIGISFMKAARKNGHDFDLRSWRHEIAHDIPDGRHRRLVIADAVLQYRARSQGRLHILHRFLELDRATITSEIMVGKLSRYADLWRCWDEYREAKEWERKGFPAWTSRYTHVPRLIVVFARSQRSSPEARMRQIMELCKGDSTLQRWSSWLSFAVFDELIASGPFAHVFHQLDQEATANWLGAPADADGQAA